MNNAAVLLAAGRSTRMGNVLTDKAVLSLRGKPLLIYSLKAFLNSGVIDSFFVVYRDEAQRIRLHESIQSANLSLPNLNWVQGGAERQDSVLNALRTVSMETAFVFIHDCARPLINSDTIRMLSELVREKGAVCLAHRVTDTIKSLDAPISTVPPSVTPKDSKERESDSIGPTTVRGTLKDLDRDRLWAMETPQVFERALIVDAYEKVFENRLHITDDTAAVSLESIHVTLLENPHPNPKLTSMDDLAYIESLLERFPEEDFE